MVWFGFSLCLLYISSHNYPGGVAFSRLHHLMAGRKVGEVRVHIGVEAAMTGVSRFGELDPSWVWVGVVSWLEGICIVWPCWCVVESLSLCIGCLSQFTCLCELLLTIPILYGFSYSKVEGLEPNSTEVSSFTFLLISADEHSHYKHTHEVLAAVEGFAGLFVNFNHIPPIKLTLREKILVLVRKLDVQRLGCSIPV